MVRECKRGTERGSFNRKGRQNGEGVGGGMKRIEVCSYICIYTYIHMKHMYVLYQSQGEESVAI
jgi:hypothetical protein